MKGLLWIMSTHHHSQAVSEAKLAPPGAGQVDLACLGDAIAELSSRIQAATYELLVMIREFDERGGWGEGFRSCAHWLNWRTGLDLGAAREKVRVARALGRLPRVSDAMRRGRISYSKVRAITRVATPEIEERLLDFALAGTAAHVERLVRAWRRVDRLQAAEDEERRHAGRYLDLRVDEDGMVVLNGRLSPELGAVVQRAIEAAEERLYREQEPTPPTENVDRGPGQNDPVRQDSARQRRADALGLVAETALTADLDRGTAGDRYQVVLHLGAEGLDATADDGQAVLDDGIRVSAETSRRIACDAAVVTMRHGPDGTALDVGRRTRTIPPATRRALASRDRRCCFPGCESRRCDAHHVRHWADGGETRLDNLVLLCRRHHRAVHEEGVVIERVEGDLRFRHPGGWLIDQAPAAPPWIGPTLGPTADRLAVHGVTVEPHTATPSWGGEALDLPWAVSLLHPGSSTLHGEDVSAETSGGSG